MKKKQITGVGNVIKALIKERGITQEDLAKQTRISETSLSLLINGHTLPRKETLKIISGALGVDPKMLLILGIKREDIREDRRYLYDLLWPDIKSMLINLFIK